MASPLVHSLFMVSLGQMDILRDEGGGFAWGPGEKYEFILQHPGEEPREPLATVFD